MERREVLKTAGAATLGAVVFTTLAGCTEEDDEEYEEEEAEGFDD